MSQIVPFAPVRRSAPLASSSVLAKHDEGQPFTDHKLYATTSPVLGPISRVLRCFVDGHGALMDVASYTGLVLTRNLLSCQETAALRQVYHC